MLNFYKINFEKIKILIQSNGFISFGFGEEEIILSKPFKNNHSINKSLEKKLNK